MDSIIEQQRQAYEDAERLEQAIVDLMLQDLTKHRYRLTREQKISGLLEQIQDRSRLITELDADKSGLRAKEAACMDNGFDEFYARLDGIRAYHRRNPGLAVRPPELDYVKYAHNPEEADEKRRVREARAQANAQGDEADPVLLDADDTETFVGADDMRRLDAMFSGDERFGRYVDLNEQHEQFVNLRLVRKLSYVEYLGECTRFADIPAQAKKDPRYAEYLRSMRTYFEGFFARAMPLFNLPEEQREAARVFDREWAPPSDGALFCAPCQRQFEKETTYAAHMGSRKHQRTVARAESSDNVGQQPTRDRDAEQRDLAWHEHLITRYAATLADRLLDTRANITRRQALTEDERAHELHDADDDELLAAADDDGAGEQLYNPLNLPLGWDGKPIPFWLYKLHGLGVTFTCEICGNSVYRGRKAYERHFQEPRHATNMRRLGIPNTRQFHGVAGIDEALELWARVDKEKRQTSVNADTFEEYEDSEGNVFSKKTYFDLKRQGLI